MASPDRTARGMSPLWFLAAASGLFVSLGIVQARLRLNADASQTATLIDFTLVAGAEFALLYGTYRASRSSIHASLYTRITG